MNALRVLVAEDNAIIGMLLADMLGEMGHDVCGVATTEADTVAAAAACKPELMIVDGGLGDGSGVAAMRQILRAGPMPHLFISGTVVDVDNPDTVVLQKPFDERQLASAIARVVAVQVASAVGEPVGTTPPLVDG
jgi:CheY-like chemotaxis protein